MAINFGAEYRRFNEEMEKKHQLYTQLEMTQEQIDALDAFDKEEFLSNNNYKRHISHGKDLLHSARQSSSAVLFS